MKTPKTVLPGFGNLKTFSQAILTKVVLLVSVRNAISKFQNISQWHKIWLIHYMENGIKFQKINFTPTLSGLEIQFGKKCVTDRQFTASKLHPYIFHCNIGNNIILLVIFVFPDHFHRQTWIKVLISLHLYRKTKKCVRYGLTELRYHPRLPKGKIK